MPDPEKIKVTLDVAVTDQDIEDIMTTVLYGAIDYWVLTMEATEPKYPLSDQLTHGGAIRIWTDSHDSYTLTKSNFLTGLTKYLQEAPIHLEAGELDPGVIDADDADLIIQYALFGELVYS